MSDGGLIFPKLISTMEILDPNESVKFALIFLEFHNLKTLFVNFSKTIENRFRQNDFQVSFWSTHYITT